MVSVNVVWFRNDLRVQDHPALSAAMSAPGVTVGLYVMNEHWNALTSEGHPKIGDIRKRFILESLEDLRAQLKKLGIPLVIRHGSVTEAMTELANVVEIRSIHYSAEPAPEEQSETAPVEALHRGKCHRHENYTLIHPKDLPFTIEELPNLFTTFRKAVESDWRIRPIAPLPKPQPLPEIDIDPGEVPASLDLAKSPFPGGESAALARVKHYLWDTNRLRTYKETRNGMLLLDDSSKFSPYLAHGCISARSIYWEIKRYEAERGANDSTYWLIFELLWRDFFRFTLEKFGAKLFRRSGLQGLDLPWSRNKEHLEAWRAGRTGFPLVDAAMRELQATGYTSNRSRQIVASFCTKNLGLDWRLGAEWFESQLVDYEVGSNYGNWQYAAGVGNDAREFRLFNLKRQAQQYDPDGKFVKYWLPNRHSENLPEIVNFDQSARENRLKYERAASAMDGKSKPFGRHR
ncbi:PhrB Deoxyribodipyrimidine photolyase [Fimbriimonadaceae bacterium]